MNSFTYFTVYCWLALLAYWISSRWNVKKTIYRQPHWARFLVAISMFLAFDMLYDPRLWRGFLAIQVLHSPTLWGWAGVIVCLAGVAFAIWARYILGSNWSAQVTLKEGHELIQRGPYRWVRHPIYTGFLLGALGTAMTMGQVRCFAGLLVLFISFWFKLKAEEGVMTRQFPSEYPAYRQRVKALIPYIL